MRSMPGPQRCQLAVVAGVLLGAGFSACSPRTEEVPDVSDAPHLVQLLAQGEAVFGIFSGDHSMDQGAVMVQNRETDFVFYSLESGPFDIPAMEAYMRGMVDGAGDHTVHPVALRIPPIRDDADSAQSRTRQGLQANVSAVVFPHVMDADEARLPSPPWDRTCGPRIRTGL